MVTLVLTSCGRLDLLNRTIESFLKFNTYPIENWIITEDSADEEIMYKIIDTYPDFEIIWYPKNRGQIACIDDAYSRVKTPYIFHLEDDWEFIKSGFIEDSLKILKANPKILQVWIRGDQDPNGHPIESKIYEVSGVKYKLVGTDHQGVWHGFTFNPGLRRLADYNLVAPFTEIWLDEYSMANQGVQENHIGRVYYEKYGFRAVSLIPEYCIHIGVGRRTYTN